MNRDPHIAALIMCKNEEKRIGVTLESLLSRVDSIIIYDTGSTDNTISILRDFCSLHDIPLHIKVGEFTDFSTSRNISLDFANTFKNIDYLLLMDVNDELRGGQTLRKVCREFLHMPDYTGFMLCQEWWSGVYTKYYNIRLIKAHGGWKYFHPVHEWIKDENNTDNEDKHIIKVVDGIVIYQDRTQDDDRSTKRHIRDKELLLKEHIKNPTETRILFYLAQTFFCIDDFHSAYRYYKMRSELDGFLEEKFHAFYKCGDITVKLGYPWDVSLSWYMKALEVIYRIEPLIRITEHYISYKQWNIANIFLKQAISLEYPAHLNLFVDRLMYDYNRWHLLGIISYHLNNRDDGILGCMNALKVKPDSETDKFNLTFYTQEQIKS